MARGSGMRGAAKERETGAARCVSGALGAQV